MGNNLIDMRLAPKCSTDRGKKRQKPSRGEHIELHVNGIAEDDRGRSIQSAAPEDVIESLTEDAFAPRQRPRLIHELSKLDLAAADQRTLHARCREHWPLEHDFTHAPVLARCTHHASKKQIKATLAQFTGLLGGAPCDLHHMKNDTWMQEIEMA